MIFKVHKQNAPRAADHTPASPSPVTRVDTGHDKCSSVDMAKNPPLSPHPLNRKVLGRAVDDTHYHRHANPLQSQRTPKQPACSPRSPHPGLLLRPLRADRGSAWQPHARSDLCPRPGKQCRTSAPLPTAPASSTEPGISLAINQRRPRFPAFHKKPPVH